MHINIKRLVAGLSASLSLPILAFAPITHAATNSFSSFTSAEVNTWITDRAEPSGGRASVSAQGRTNVLQLKVDHTKQAIGTFERTEGIQKRQNYGNSINADLYVDSAWSNINVRAGLWGIGIDGPNSISEYPIIEFTTAGDQGFKGWRVWDNNGWHNKVPASPNMYGKWARLSLELDSGNFIYRVNGNTIATLYADGTTSIDGAIFNSYNYGTVDYTVLWHNGDVLNKKDECKEDGWKNIAGKSFKNQGDCVSFYANKEKD